MADCAMNMGYQLSLGNNFPYPMNVMPRAREERQIS